MLVLEAAAKADPNGPAARLVSPPLDAYVVNRGDRAEAAALPGSRAARSGAQRGTGWVRLAFGKQFKRADRSGAAGPGAGGRGGGARRSSAEAAAAAGRRPPLRSAIAAMVEELRTLEMRIHLVTGGAGFLGSHLIDRLMQAGDEVICLDNYFTGRKANIARWIGHPRFELIRHDVTEPTAGGGSDLHLACPASRSITSSIRSRPPRPAS